MSDIQGKLPFFGRLITSSENRLHKFGEQFFQIEGTSWGRTFSVDGDKIQEFSGSRGAGVRNFLRIIGTLTIIPAAIALASKLHHRLSGNFQLITEPQGEAQKAHVAASDIMPTFLPAGGVLNGPLGEKFKWPSDHLPIGGNIILNQGTPLRFVSYNVLKQEPLERYIKVKDDPQGLNGSAITSLSKNQREELIANQIIDMIHAGQDVVCLQECSRDVEKLIKKALPKGFKIAFSGSEGLCIYNGNEYRAREKIDRAFSNHNKYVNYLELEVKETGEKIRIANTHVQQGETDRLASSIVNNKDHIPTLLMGDMNAMPNVVEESLGNKMEHTSISGNKPTHINTKKTLACYDQVHLITAAGQTPLRASVSTQPQDIFKEGSKSCLLLREAHKTVQENLK